jgi:hypothetical protein
MRVQFSVFGLPLETAEEQRSPIGATIRDTIVRMAPTGVGGPLNHIDILGQYRMPRANQRDVAGSRIFTVRVGGYPSVTDGACCTLACEIGTGLEALFARTGVAFDKLLCVVDGMDGHRGTYVVTARPQNEPQPEGGVPCRTS